MLPDITLWSFAGWIVFAFMVTLSLNEDQQEVLDGVESIDDPEMKDVLTFTQQVLIRSSAICFLVFLVTGSISAFVFLKDFV